MRPVHAALLACCLASPVLATPEEAPPGRLTEDAMFADDASGLRPEDSAWSPDGSRLIYRWGQDQEEALWQLDVATGKSEVLLRPGEDLPIEEFQWSPRGDALLLVADGDLYLYPLSDRKLRRLTRTAEAEENPGFSPDGSRLAFLRGCRRACSGPPDSIRAAATRRSCTTTAARARRW